MLGNLGLWLNNETQNVSFPVDVAVALGGGSDRQVAAAQAIAHKQAKALWVTGPELDVPITALEGDSFLYRPNGTTWTDAQDVLGALLQAEKMCGYKSALIYTSDYHIRRAQIIFDYTAKNVYHASFNIQWRAVPNAMFKLEDWYKTSQGKQIVLNEYAGIVTALLKRKH